MAETRVLAPLLHLVEQADGKALLVGDPGQLPAVGAGGLYPALCERLGTIELSVNRRQRDRSERQALAQLRAGNPEPYLAHAANHGRLALDNDPTAAKQRLLTDWWQTAQQDGVGSVMLAYGRGDVRDLNRAAHALMFQSGRLGREALNLEDREIRVGDRVLCRRNDPQLGVRNGTRGTIVDLNPASLTLSTDSGFLRPLPLAYAAEQLDHAYALTGHAAQGATVDRAFVLLHGEGALQEWGYVACSRARTETRLYLAGERYERESHGCDPSVRAGSERVAHALTVSASEPLALDQTRAASGTTVRLVARQEHQLERQRVQAHARLVAAEHKLEALGWRGRRRWGAEPRAEIALQHAALRLVHEKGAELAASRTTHLPLPTFGSHELGRARPPQRRLERPPTLEL